MKWRWQLTSEGESLRLSICTNITFQSKAGEINCKKILTAFRYEVRFRLKQKLFLAIIIRSLWFKHILSLLRSQSILIVSSLQYFRHICNKYTYIHSKNITPFRQVSYKNSHLSSINQKRPRKSRFKKEIIVL